MRSKLLVMTVSTIVNYRNEKEYNRKLENIKKTIERGQESPKVHVDIELEQERDG